MSAFADESRRVLSRLRSAYGDLVVALGNPDRAADLQERLELDKKLAWRVHRLTRTTDPLECAAFVPSNASARRVSREARRRGVDAALTDAVVEATADYERSVKELAKDRGTFEAMTAAASGAGLGPILDDARRSAYRANVVLHGRSSETMVFAFVVAPGDVPGRLRGVSLRGHVGLQRLRPGAATEIARHRFDHGGVPLAPAAPLDAEAARAHGAPLLSRFSELGPSDIRHVEAESGFYRSFLSSADLGIRSACTFMLGDRGDELELDEDGLGSLCEVSTPTRRLVHDFVIHRDVPVEAPELRVVLSRRDAASWPAPDATGVLPLETRVHDLGAGLASVDVAGWDRHRELLQTGVDALGIDAGDVRVHRVVVEYPVQHSVVWLRSRPSAS